MSLNKQSVVVNFSQGLDTKTDKHQVPIGRFLELKNSNFDKGGLLQKTLGFKQLPSLPNTTSKALATYANDIVAVGDILTAYSENTSKWVEKDILKPIGLSVLPIIRNNSNQSHADFAIYNNVMCIGYTEDPNIYKYAFVDCITGQIIKDPITISSNVTSVVKVYALNNLFFLIYRVATSLRYQVISALTLENVVPETNLVTNSTGVFDAVQSDNKLYVLAGTSSDTKLLYFIGSLNIVTTLSIADIPTKCSITADSVTNNIYVALCDSSNTVKSQAFDSILTPLNSLTTIKSTTDVVNNLTIVAYNGACAFFYEYNNSYGYDSNIPTHYVVSNYYYLSTNTVTALTEVVRSVGLTSKAFVLGGNPYFIGAYDSDFQPTYFVFDMNGIAIAKLAYSNGGGYTTELSNTYVNGDMVYFTYLFKDSVSAVNKSEGVDAVGGVFSQTGINLATLNFNDFNISSVEAAEVLSVSGGVLWEYDGLNVSESGFHLYPDYVEGTINSVGGSLSAQKYFYKAVYEWTDNNGILHKSAPSIPLELDLTNTPSYGAQTNASFTTGGGTTVMTVNSTDGFKIGLKVYNKSNPNAFAAGAGLTISAIGSGTITVTPAVSSASSSQGDVIYQKEYLFSGVFLAGSNKLTVTDPTGLYIGQKITDITTPGNLSGNTYIADINGNSITMSQNAVANSAGDNLFISSQNIVAKYDTGVTLITLRSAFGVNVGDYINGLGIQQGTKITALNLVGGIYEATIDKVTTTASSAVVLNASYTAGSPLVQFTAAFPQIMTGSEIVGVGTIKFYNLSTGVATLTANAASSSGGIIAVVVKGYTQLNAVTDNVVSSFETGDLDVFVSSTTALSVGQLVLDTTTPANVPSGASFTANFTAVSTPNTTNTTTIVISGSTATAKGLFVGQLLTSSAFVSGYNYYITAIALDDVTLTLSLPLASNVSSSASFTPSNAIKAIDAVNSKITLAYATAGNSAKDVLATVDTLSTSINVPTLRITQKIENPVKIVLYRFSTAQQTYYRVTSVTNPTLNDTSIDYVTISDTLNDLSIIGNDILYTTGGVIENIGPPAVSGLTLFDNRVWAINAEDTNSLWFSKQIIQNVPVEMSDLFTVYTASTASPTGNTGGVQALYPMDDKLIIFKKGIIYYLVGRGPDNTGANNQYSDPVFVNGTVGCSNPKSVVFIPDGLMFQSEKGIWLLGRDISTKYIGAAVEDYTKGAKVISSLNIPDSNQVRLILDNGITLMYDYFFNQWSTFDGMDHLSCIITNGKHTSLDKHNRVSREHDNYYLNIDKPVLMSFKTSWINLAGVQGFERFYFFYLLGLYKSPHFLEISIAYDYNEDPVQTITIKPDNSTEMYGDLSNWGAGLPWGGTGEVEQWRVFPKIQKCQSFQLHIKEVYNDQAGQVAGAGLSLSGINMLVGSKGSYTKLRASKSVG